MRDKKAVSFIYDKMSAPAQFHFGVPRDSITSILQYLSVGVMWPPGCFHILLIISKLYWDQHCDWWFWE